MRWKAKSSTFVGRNITWQWLEKDDVRVLEHLQGKFEFKEVESLVWINIHAHEHLIDVCICSTKVH
jgi:hypothetical protein